MKTDVQIHKDVLEELKWEPSIREGGIAASVKDGVVTLSGAVESYLEKKKAEDAAKRVAGVKAVVENIEVKLPFSNVRADEDIAKAALSAFGWDVAIPANRFQVIVEDGIVTLEGSADWQYQRTSAERIARNLKGVRSVINRITVKPQVSGQEIKNKIESALKRHAELEAAKITVVTAGDEVILRGWVDSWTEKEAAEDAAWSAPGVRIVRDEIRVNP